MGDNNNQKNSGASATGKIPTVISRPATKQEGESAYLLFKQTVCPICDNEFKTRSVKSAGVRRIGSDRDLRPIFAGIDSIKYTLSSCPECGYTAMTRYFSPLNKAQINFIKKDALPKIEPTHLATPETYSYNDALELYRRALICASAKKAKISEISHTFLQTSWLLRGMRNNLVDGGVSENNPKILKLKQQEDLYYKKAFDGFMKSLQQENFPIAGMDENTFNYLLAQMSFKLEKYDITSKLVSRIIVNHAAPHNVREKARDLKDEVLEIMAAQKKAEEEASE